MCRLLVLLAACSFSPRSGFPDATGTAPVDAAIDGALPLCHAVPASGGSAGGAIGGGGGSPQPLLTCPAFELPIGLGFEMSQSTLSNHNDENAAVTVHIHCGRITRAASWTTVPDATVTGNATESCSGYEPTTIAADVDCPSGFVMVGLIGNEIDSTLYNNVWIVCAPLEGSSAVGSATMTLPVTGTASFTNHPQATTCPSGTAIVTFGSRAACGQDALSANCAALACE